MALALSSSLADTLIVAVAGSALWAVLSDVFAAFEPRSRAPGETQVEVAILVQRNADVRRRRWGSLVWNAIGRDARLFERDAVYAADDATATIRFADGALLEIGEKSLVVVHRPQRETGGALVVDVRGGDVRGVAGRGAMELRAGASRLALSPQAAAHLRRDRGATEVEVVTGRGELRTATGRAVLPPRSRSAIADGAGGMPLVRGLDVALLAPVASHTLFTADEVAVQEFVWQAPGGARQLLFELSRNAQFSDVVVRRGTSGGSLRLGNLSPGVYYWRLRWADGGDGGSERRVLIVRRVLPPVPYLPHRDADVVLGERGIKFAWAAAEERGEHEIELARGERFEKPLVQRRVPVAQLQLTERLPEGRYCYRVRFRPTGAIASAWSAPSCFFALDQPRLDGPELYEPRIERIDSGGRR